jgi:hypothetical protein
VASATMVVTPASPIAVATPVAAVTTFAVAKAEDFLDLHFFSLFSGTAHEKLT